MTVQLRIYAIKPGKMDAFLKGWIGDVYPLRRKHGFRIPGAWAIQETNTFVWLLEYDGPEGFEAKDAAYYASEDRTSLDPDPATHVEKAEQRFVRTIVPMSAP